MRHVRPSKAAFDQSSSFGAASPFVPLTELSLARWRRRGRSRFSCMNVFQGCSRSRTMNAKAHKRAASTVCHVLNGSCPGVICVLSTRRLEPFAAHFVLPRSYSEGACLSATPRSRKMPCKQMSNLPRRASCSQTSTGAASRACFTPSSKRVSVAFSATILDCVSKPSNGSKAGTVVGRSPSSPFAKPLGWSPAPSGSRSAACRSGTLLRKRSADRRCEGRGPYALDLEALGQ